MDGQLLFFSDGAAELLGRRFEEVGRLSRDECAHEVGPLGSSVGSLHTLTRLRGLLPVVIAGTFAATSGAALSSPVHGGPLSGTWSGVIAGNPGTGIGRQHIRITVNASQSGGSWSLGSACHGELKLDSISNGYHHYLRKRARGSTCQGGDIDCLKRVGATVYDAVTSHRGGQYDMSGTLRRVRGH